MLDFFDSLSLNELLWLVGAAGLVVGLIFGVALFDLLDGPH
jgi:hypothetical protein